MSNTCANCAFWGAGAGDDAYAGWEARSVGFRRCSGVQERWTIGEGSYLAGEDQDQFAARRIRELSEARAYVEDGSEYMANLVTGPDFFCALHSPTPSNQEEQP